MARSLPLVAAMGIVLAAWAPAVWAQPGIEEVAAPSLPGLAPLSEVAVLEVPRTASVESRSMIGPDVPDGPFVFADPFAVAVGPSTHGRWEVTTDEQTAVWRLRVVSEGAVSLNFGFARYRMPADGRLRIHTPDGSEVVGPYTEADNEEHGELWTPVLPGGEAVIEVAVPVGRLGEVELEIGSVNRGLRDLRGVFREVFIGGRAACNIDVACKSGDPYRDQIGSVGLMQYGGTGGCSGVLLNNTAEDGKPYFLTAFHCGFRSDPEANARSVVIYWNFEKPGCGSGSGSRSQTQSGAHYRSGHGAADIALIELDDALDPAHELFLAGWDRSGSVVGFPTAVHHAAADVKSITPFSAPAFPGSDASYASVWASGGGIIQNGSSGSPMFDDVGRVAGTTSGVGSGSGCHGGRYYAGRLGSAWASLGSWLDPASTGATSLDGIEADTGPLSLRALDDKAVKAPGDGEPAEALAVDVAPFFWSRGGSLAYTASSSDESAATVSVSGSVVTLTPVAAGSSTITVTAADAGDSSRSVTATFLVTVGSNRSPEPSGALADRSLNEGGVSQVALTSAFTDGDGDALTYAASSTDTSVATVALSGSSVVVTAVNGPGTATIDVAATDASGSGTRARHRFDVTVLNEPPRAVGSLAGVTLHVGEGNEVLDLVEAFTEPEGEALTYRVWSSASSVARATLSGSQLTLIPESPGNATFTVWARERAARYASATQTLDVLVKAERGLVLSTRALTLLEGRRATYTVRLKSEPEGEVKIAPSVSGGKATVSPSSLKFDATDWETAQTVTVEGVEDADSERESATISHAVSGANYDAITAPSVSLTVLDDEAPPVVSLAAVSAAEDAGAMTFEVTLSHAADVEVLVDYATSDFFGARAGADYTATSGTLAFPAGTTSRQVVVDITDDDEFGEEEETFVLTIENARNATILGDNTSALSATGTIVDDDGPLVRASWLQKHRRHEVEEDRDDVFVGVHLGLDRHPERQVTIRVEGTPDGGADETDYEIPTSTARVVFPYKGGGSVIEARTRIKAIDDDFDDDCESVILKLVSESPGVTVDDGEMRVWIVDNDGASRDCGSGGGSPPGGGGGGPSPPPEPEPPSPPRSRPPTAEFTVEGATCDGEFCRAVAGEALRFTDTSTGTVRFRRWEFGDGDTSRSGRPVHVWSTPGFHEVTLEVSDGTSPSTVRRTFLVTAAEPAGTCVADVDTLCLQDSRYAVTVEWRDGEGGAGSGRVVHAGTNDSGMFSFFDRSNWEVLIKVLDGCAANGHVWVFGGSTTDLGYAIRVTDTSTGVVKQYRNEPGTAAAAITDVEAFPGVCRR
ncbi:MAG: PKD domain-containing protein [Holophagales bacterium]|nr:PKD domain-containing protein [Holophagales bacterium]